MKEIILSFDEIKSKVLDLGHCGDTGNLAIKFDCIDFFKDKETKNAKLLISKPDGTNASEILTVEDGIAVYVIGTGITDVSGFGAYQLKIDDGTNVLHYPEGTYFVGGVIEESEPPTPPTPAGLTGRTFLLNETISYDGEDPTGFANVNTSVEPMSLNDLFTVNIQGTPTMCCACVITPAYEEEYPRLTYTIKDTGNAILAYKQGEWLSEEIRTITFAEEPKEDAIQGMHYMSTEETLAWLADNATEITE